MYRNTLDLNSSCPLNRERVGSSCCAAFAWFVCSSLAGTIPALCEDDARAPRGLGRGSLGTRACVAALSEKGMQTPSSAERPLLSARKQSAFCLAQLSVQKMSLSLCGAGVSSPLLKNPVIQPAFGGGTEPRSYGERDEFQPWPYGTRNPPGVSGTALPPAPQGQQQCHFHGVRESRQALGGSWLRRLGLRSPRYGEASPPRAVAQGGPELRLAMGRGPSLNQHLPGLSAYWEDRPRFRI